MNKPDKKFETGLRILEVLQILLECDVTKNQLIEKMNDNNLFENVYTFEAFIKYFNTLSLFGFKIEKERNVYKLRNALEELELNKNEFSMLLELIKYTKKLHNKSLENTIKNVFYKSVKYLEEDCQNKIVQTLKESAQSIEGNNLISTLESFLYDNRLLSVTYLKNNNVQETLILQLKEIIENKNDIILIFYDKKRAKKKKINSASILSITQMPNKTSQECYSNDSIVFRIHGRLAQVYRMKEGESTVDFTAGYKTISNKGEDRDVIIKRLLKYGENCQIIKPDSLKEEFLSMTNQILNNLEEETV